jgi:hypothetical protein
MLPGPTAFGKPAALFTDEYDFGQGMLRRGARGGRLGAVIHWTEELKQILAAGGVRSS